MHVGLLRRLRPPPPAAASLEAALVLGLGDKENSVEGGQCSQVSTGMCTKLEELSCMLVASEGARGHLGAIAANLPDRLLEAISCSLF